MGDHTKIEWTNFFGPNSGATWNPLAAYYEGKRGWACVRHDPACDNCYAQLLNERAPFGMGTGLPYDTRSMSKVKLELINLDQPLKWNKPRGVFTISMSDLFGNFVPEDYRRAIFTIMDFASQHVFITLTKRIPEMVDWYIKNSWKTDQSFSIRKQFLTPAIEKAYKQWDGGQFPSPNVIVGISIGHQKIADKALPDMRTLRQHFPDMTIMISNEPAIGPVDWSGWENIVSWMVTGGESGDKARPMLPAWERHTREWSVRNNIPYFFKQWGEWSPDGEIIKEKPNTPALAFDGIPMFKVGKNIAGHLVDGMAWQQFPVMS